MAAKLIQGSSNGSTYFTLPGSTGDFSVDQEGITDTIFGQSYNSTESGLISWTMSANAMFKGFAGYIAKITKSGTATAAPSGTVMSLVEGTTGTYAAPADKNLWDRSATVTIYEGDVDVTDDVESIDYLFGRVTFTSGSEPTGAVTAAFTYFGQQQYGTAQDFTLTMNADTVDTTDFDTAQGNDGHRTYRYGLKSVSLSLSGFFNTENKFKDAVTDRKELMIEINPDGNSKSVARGFFKAINTSQSGDVGGDESEDVGFELSVPYSDGESITPFSWVHASDSTIPTAIKLALTAWADGSEYHLKYLPDGTSGWKGEVILTDVSLSSGLSAMNEFSISAQGTGKYSKVP